MFDPLVNVCSKATRLLVGAVVSACEHHCGAVDLLQHLIEVLLGCLHCRADERVDVDTGKDLGEERMRRMDLRMIGKQAPLHMMRVELRPSFPSRCPSHHRLAHPPGGSCSSSSWTEKLILLGREGRPTVSQPRNHEGLLSGSYL